MRFKDIKQHKKSEIDIEVVEDKFGNISIIVRNQEKEIVENNVSRSMIDKVSKKLIKKLK